MVTPADLELGAAQALFAARTLNAAVHDAGPWEMRWGPVTVPAVREVREDDVAFTAVFPDACWLEAPDDGVVLLLRGEIMGMKRMEHPGDTEFVVTWRLAESRVSA